MEEQKKDRTVNKATQTGVFHVHGNVQPGRGAGVARAVLQTRDDLVISGLGFSINRVASIVDLLVQHQIATVSNISTDLSRREDKSRGVAPALRVTVSRGPFYLALKRDLINKFSDVFSILDEQKDGFVSVDRFRQALTDLHFAPKELEEDADKFLGSAGAQVTLQSFLHYFAVLASQDNGATEQFKDATTSLCSSLKI